MHNGKFIYQTLTRKGIYWIKLEADSILRQLQGPDTHFWEEGVQLFYDLQKRSAETARKPINTSGDIQYQTL